MMLGLSTTDLSTTDLSNTGLSNTGLSKTVSNAINELIQTIGSPLFFYDLDSFEQHIIELVQGNFVLWYAVKANPLSSVIKVLAANGFGFDVASIGELDQVLAQGVNPERILNTGPAKSSQQLTYFLDRGVSNYVVESIQQLDDLQKLAPLFDITPQVLLRVQLDWANTDLSSDNPLGGNQITPFGLSRNDWLSIEICNYPALNIKGLHIFQWGNILSANELSQLWNAMVAPLKTLAEQLDLEIQVLDLGGGLGIPYDVSQTPLDWNDITVVLSKLKLQLSSNEVSSDQSNSELANSELANSELANSELPNSELPNSDQSNSELPNSDQSNSDQSNSDQSNSELPNSGQSPSKQLWMELGRFAIGPFGYYVTQIVDRKTNHGQQQLILAGGINHLMRPLISGQAFPASLLRQSKVSTQTFHVYGPLCTGLDKLGIYEFPSDVAIGDTLVFSQCGAYGFSESMPFFLCHTLPAEAIIHQGKITVMRKPQQASSWLR